MIANLNPKPAEVGIKCEGRILFRHLTFHAPFLKKQQRQRKKPRKCSPAKLGSKSRQERTRVQDMGPRRAAKEKPKVSLTAASCEPGPVRAGQLRPGGRHPREMAQ